MIDLNTYIYQCAPQIAPSTMSAIVKTESKGNILAINLNKGKKLGFQPRNYNEALNWVNYLETHNYDFDVGLAQVNIRNIHKYGYKAQDLLNPCINLRVAGQILSNSYLDALNISRDSHQALLKAISAYNTGNYQRGFNNGYVKRVVKNAFYFSSNAKDNAKVLVYYKTKKQLKNETNS